MVWEALAAAPLVLLGLPGEWRWGQHWRGNSKMGLDYSTESGFILGKKYTPPKKTRLLKKKMLCIADFELNKNRLNQCTIRK